MADIRRRLPTDELADSSNPGKERGGEAMRAYVLRDEVRNQEITETFIIHEHPRI